jgi:hypothetical protein
MVFAILYLILSLLVGRCFIETIIILLKFKNFSINLFGDEIIVQTDAEDYGIPMNKDTNVLFFMNGWLISWRSKKGQRIFLIPRELAGDQDQFLEMIFYFREKTNYIPSKGIVSSHYKLPGYNLLDYYQPDADYIAAKEEKNKILKSLKINPFWQFTMFYNRLKYMKLSDLNKS